jgi:hypothetical protein
MSTLQGARLTQKAVVSALAIFVCLVLSGTAQAGPLAPGDALVGPDVFSIGTWTLKSSIQIRAVSNGEPDFTLISAVYDTGNLDCVGCLAFVYQISNSSASTDSITRLTAIDFSRWTTYVGYANNGGSLGGPFVDGDAAPSDVDRSGGLGGTIGFDMVFSNASILPPGSTSKVLVIQTNATNFAEGTVGVYGTTSGPGNLVDPFAPAGPSAVPEPASLALLGIGLLTGIGVLAFIRSRKARVSA